MLTIIKNFFSSEKDASGRNVDEMIMKLAAQSRTSVYTWSYIKEESYYENTATGRRIYSHDVSQYAA